MTFKVAVISDSRIPSERANSIAVANTSQGFAEVGCEVTLIIPHNPNNDISKIEDRFGFKPKFKLLQLKTPAPTFLGKKIWFQLKSWKFANAVKKYLKDSDYDLVYTRSQYVAFLCPCVFEAHSYSWTKKLMTRKRPLITINKVIRDKFGRGTAIHLGYRRHPTTNIVKSKILVLGNPKTPLKGTDVTIVTNVAHKEVYNYLDGADILFLPSTGKFNTPLKLIEYLSTNKPIIYPNQPNVTEIINSKPISWEERAEKILICLQNDHYK